MPHDPQLVIFSTDSDEVNRIAKKFENAPSVIVVQANGPEASKRCHLDAFWLTPMQASYHGVGALPPHLAKVFPMPAEKRLLGLPRHIIAGVSLEPGRQYTPRFLETICAKALRDAIDEYNRKHEDSILRVGTIRENLSLDERHATPEAFQAVRTAFCPSDESIAMPVRQRISA